MLTMFNANHYRLPSLSPTFHNNSESTSQQLDSHQQIKKFFNRFEPNKQLSEI